MALTILEQRNIWVNVVGKNTDKHHRIAKKYKADSGKYPSSHIHTNTFKNIAPLVLDI